jgi:nitroimidazol reductase NimA-like FMN-containing flavoprotein (pyridoxamine 5'-phosphate oxidase superfamily)
MRRKEKEMDSLVEAEVVIRNSLVCRLGLSDDNRPYVVPLSFGYENNTLYFHSASEGKKVEILKKNSNVCFEFDIETLIMRWFRPKNPANGA